MRVLVTGGTGQTGGAVVRGLRARGASPRIATRRPGGADEVRFDWHDVAGHDAALRGVDAVYLVAPALVHDPAPAMIGLIDRALGLGVERFVLLSSSAIDERAPGLGAVDAALRARAPAWTVLRPSWFMQNFVDQRHPLARGIREDGAFATATGRGRVGFIDAGDIAAVAVAGLFEPANAALVLTGPAALAYDEAAEILAEAWGRRVVHTALPPADMQGRLVAAGMPADYAALLTALEQGIARGSEDRVTDEVLRRTGRPPRSLQEFARAAVPGGT